MFEFCYRRISTNSKLDKRKTGEHVTNKLLFDSHSKTIDLPYPCKYSTTTSREPSCFGGTKSGTNCDHRSPTWIFCILKGEKKVPLYSAKHAKGKLLMKKDSALIFHDCDVCISRYNRFRITEALPRNTN